MHFLLSPHIILIPFGFSPKKDLEMFFLRERIDSGAFFCAHVSQTLNEVESDLIIHCRKNETFSDGSLR